MTEQRKGLVNLLKLLGKWARGRILNLLGMTILLLLMKPTLTSSEQIVSLYQHG